MEKWKLFVEKVNTFVKSDWYIVLSATVVFVGWVSGQWAVFLCVLAALCALPLFVTDNNRSFLSFFLQFTFIISHERHALNSYWWLLFLLIPILGGGVFQAIRYRKSYRWDMLSLRKVKGQHFFLLLFAIPFIFGGVTRAHEKPIVILFAFLIILLIGAAYTYFMAGNYGREDKKDLPAFVLKNLVAVGVIISLQMLVYYLRLGAMDAILDAIKNKHHALGWGGPNNIGTIYTLTIPATFYFCTRKSRFTPLYALLAMIQYALLLSTGSRGSIFVVTFALPAIVLYIMAVTPQKRAFGISLCAIIAVGLLGLLLVADKIVPALADRLSMGFSSNGRLEFEYPAAIEAFKTYPLFGAGWDYMMGTKINDGYTPLWFHSSLLQVMAMMGCFGLLFYGIWFFQRYRTFYLMRHDKRVLFLGVSTLLFEAYCMVDTGFFSPSFLIMMLVMQLAVEVNLPDDKGFAIPRRWLPEKALEPADET